MNTPNSVQFRSFYRSPLSQPVFYVMLALARGEEHGYALLSRVADISLAAVSMKTGTLYPLLRRLMAAGLVREAGYAATQREGLPRRYYALTPQGLILVKSELRRLKHAVQIGEHLGLLNDEMPLDIQLLLANNTD